MLLHEFHGNYFHCVDLVGRFVFDLGHVPVRPFSQAFVLV
jgi:hypothetical protein